MVGVVIVELRAITIVLWIIDVVDVVVGFSNVNVEVVAVEFSVSFDVDGALDLRVRVLAEVDGLISVVVVFSGAVLTVDTKAVVAITVLFILLVIMVDIAMTGIVVGITIFWRPNAKSGHGQLQSHCPFACIVPVPCTSAAKVVLCVAFIIMVADVIVVGLLVVIVETRAAGAKIGIEDCLHLV